MFKIGHDGKYSFLGLNSRLDWDLNADAFNCRIAEMGTAYHSQREQMMEYGQASVQHLDRCTMTELVHSSILIGARGESVCMHVIGADVEIHAYYWCMWEECEWS